MQYKLNIIKVKQAVWDKYDKEQAEKYLSGFHDGHIQTWDKISNDAKAFSRGY